MTDAPVTDERRTWFARIFLDDLRHPGATDLSAADWRVLIAVSVYAGTSDGWTLNKRTIASDAQVSTTEAVTRSLRRLAAAGYVQRVYRCLGSRASDGAITMGRQIASTYVVRHASKPANPDLIVVSVVDSTDPKPGRFRELARLERWRLPAEAMREADAAGDDVGRLRTYGVRAEDLPGYGYGLTADRRVVPLHHPEAEPPEVPTLTAIKPLVRAVAVRHVGHLLDLMGPQVAAAQLEDPAHAAKVARRRERDRMKATGERRRLEVQRAGGIADAITAIRVSLLAGEPVPELVDPLDSTAEIEAMIRASEARRVDPTPGACRVRCPSCGDSVRIQGMTPDLAPALDCPAGCGHVGVEVLQHIEGDPGRTPHDDHKRAAAEASALFDALEQRAAEVEGAATTLEDRCLAVACRRSAARLARWCTSEYPIGVAIDAAILHARGLLDGRFTPPVDWHDRAFPPPDPRNNRTRRAGQR